MKDKLKNCIANQLSVSDEVLETIADKFSPLSLNSGWLLAEPGVISSKLAFIADGAMRMYNLVDGHEVTIWIGLENRFITDLTSFVHEIPARWYIEAVKPSSLLTISRTDHLNLLSNCHEWLEFDNRLLTSAYSILEQRIFSHLYMSAEERYDRLFETEPKLFNRVPLKQIASMLAMTPETLSRLRAKQRS